MAKPVIVLNVHFMMSGSRSKQYQAQSLLTSTTLVKFLEDNQLLNRKVLDENGELSKKEKIFETDLMPDGVALFWGGFTDKWYALQDKGVAIENVKTLENGLKAVRKIGAAEFLKTTRYYTYHVPLH
jgi:hypothetical protein